MRRIKNRKTFFEYPPAALRKSTSVDGLRAWNGASGAREGPSRDAVRGTWLLAHGRDSGEMPCVKRGFWRTEGLRQGCRA